MTGMVLTGGPSDHNPFIQDFRFKGGMGGFRACTYNVEHSNNAKRLLPIFTEITLKGAEVLLLQEVKRGKGIFRMLRSLGYRHTYALPEFCVAWNPKVWEYVRSWRPLMSPTKYWTTNYALVVVMKHKATGNLVKFMTYHPPAHVQAPKHKTFKTVTKVLHEVVRKWNRIARRNTKHIDACCFAGDDNVDELKGYAPADEWEFMLNGPLTQVRAPKPTHGGGRRIDDFRTSGLEAA